MTVNKDLSNVAPYQEDANPKELSIYIDYCRPVTAFDVNTLMVFKQIIVGGIGGDIVFENLKGNAQCFPGALPGVPYAIRGRKILTSATIDGVLCTTSATNLFWASGI